MQFVVNFTFSKKKHKKTKLKVKRKINNRKFTKENERKIIIIKCEGVSRFLTFLKTMQLSG